jgi:hypothetical protein
MNNDREFNTDVIQLWDRQANESLKSFMLFRVYRDLGLNRSIKEACERTGRKFSYALKLATQYKWRERAEAYELFLDKKRQQIKMKEIDEMNKRHSNHSQAIENALIVPVEKFINNFKSKYGENFENMTLKDILFYIYKTAEKFPSLVDTERKARGVPTDISKQNIDLTSNGSTIPFNVSIEINGEDSPLLNKVLNDIKEAND